MKTISSDQISKGTVDWRGLLVQEEIINMKRWDLMERANEFNIK